MSDHFYFNAQKLISSSFILFPSVSESQAAAWMKKDIHKHRPKLKLFYNAV